MKSSKGKLSLSYQRGFTLIELVIVIVILGVLAVSALPKFVNLSSDANEAVIKGAVGSIGTAVSLFKIKTLTSGNKLTTVVEFSGITGNNHQPWAAMVTNAGFSAGYSSPPEIFEAAGLNVNDWAYRIYSPDTYAVVAAPRNVLDKEQPSEAEVKATNCYFNYHWQVSGKPILKTVTSNC
ncbi:MAG: prepilin-type N-terminal cleavage/methylation domain-containing protein [Gammaproteobacteria bacterium]|nr:prepilin-type N-terminal cleavage/methylation domain-containing protein [Gammaproteobacteria bacterium]